MQQEELGQPHGQRTQRGFRTAQVVHLVGQADICQ